MDDNGSLSGTVLVIEDEDVLRYAVATMLRKRGFHVIEAGDGATGTELFRNNQTTIDAILLDMTLPISNRLRSLRGNTPGSSRCEGHTHQRIWPRLPQW